MFVLHAAEDEVTFENVAEEPVPSLFRAFSAPVRVESALDDTARLTLLRHDPDSFNRWEAAQRIALGLMARQAHGETAGPAAADAFVAALDAFLDAEALRDPAFAAQILALPSEETSPTRWERTPTPTPSSPRVRRCAAASERACASA
ncbi:hypothetical protein GCM10025880_32050 [Methylorubrum aminovorans]|nr:hypothetical protein GCM10025880_32050 [Methylorubrum aminovorans]